MKISRIVAPYFGTNCWIIGNEDGGECVIVDPGIAVPDLSARINERLKVLNLKPVAALITHGHLDHTFSVVPLCTSSGIDSVYIHPQDRELIAHPEKGLGKQGLALLGELAPKKIWREPSGVVEIEDGDQIEISGMNFEIIHAPGHTRGSVMYRVGDLLLSGDVLFKGSIGRTDLPTSSPRAMATSLREKVLTLPDALTVLPGHGDETTIGLERATNPFLLEVAQ
jgi:glyoxylase-like metal-dependent hydrolase (beta-lactamase superfamily II)